MPRQIFPQELVEILSGLLLKPEIFGELDSPEKHQAFMLDIGRVVADHCGGEINGVAEPAGKEFNLSEEWSQPYLSVSPNDSLPSLLNNVWAYYDGPSGWEDDFLDCDHVDAGEPLTEKEIKAVRQQLQSLLSNIALSQQNAQSFIFQLTDWRVAGGKKAEEGDDRPYTAMFQLGNQSTIKIKDKSGKCALEVAIEIDKGVPSVRLDPNGESDILYVHSAQGGLVLTPSYQDSRFESAKEDRYTHNDNLSLVIR